jgi:CRISPR system Cascade subunit CasE
MPSEWRSGLRLRIDVLACPVSRNRGIEKDIYLREIERANPSPRSRESVYLDWFRQQWEGVVEFDSLSLTAFRRGMLLRRGHESGGDRTSHALERPRAQFNAIATISDGGAFHERLVRGIGRHRSFGFGMVLLARP